MFNTRIVTKPSVSVIAATEMSSSGLADVVAALSLEGALEKVGSPLHSLAQIIDGKSDDYTHQEILPEFAGRHCYRAWTKGRPTDEYIQNILEMEHGSVLEHTNITFSVAGVSRSLTHELVRHRVGTAISQESQRFVDASDSRFVMPPLMLHMLDGNIECNEARDWLNDKMDAVAAYERWQGWLKAELENAIDEGAIPMFEPGDPLIVDDDAAALDKQRTKALTRLKKRANEAARGELPNAIETKMVWSMNLRTARHFIMLRGSDPADLEIRRFAVRIAEECKRIAPTVFADIEIVPGTFGVPAVVGRYLKV